MRSVRYIHVVICFAVLTVLSTRPTVGAFQVVPDLSVPNIEVTQAIQTPTNTVQLIAQRSTAVRATIGIAGSSGSVPDVTGRLHVFVNGSELTPSGGLAPINAPLTAPIASQRANENHTLNFEMPAPTGITASTNVDFRVDITPLSGEANITNNFGEVLNLSFVNRTTPSLYFTRIDWTPSGLGLPNLADVQAGRGDLFVRGIYPVNDADPNLYRQGLFPTLAFTEDGDGNSILNTSPEGNNLLSLLASCRQLIVNAGLGAANNTFLYGWIAGNPIEGNGLGQVGGRNAYGNTDPTRYQRTYAHELGHNFGLNHNTNVLDEVGWDVGARLPNNPAGNNTTGRVKPLTFFDIMNAGRFTNEAWIDTTNYNFFLNNLIIASGPDAEGDLIEPSERVLVVQGIFDPSGEELLVLDPAFRFPWLSQPTVNTQQRVVENRYLVEVVDETGSETSTPFDALVADDGLDETRGFFEVMVPVPPDVEVASLRILDAQGERQFGGIERSDPPQVTVVAPSEGATLSRVTEVVWDVEDPDTPRESLQYQIAYSPDDGESWVPLAVDVVGTENRIVFSSTDIQASQGAGIIRVFVGDGLNTAFADVSNLTTGAAGFPGPEDGFSAKLEIAYPVSRTELRLVFSEALDQASAEDISNYSTREGLTVLSAALDSEDARRVTLTTEVMDGESLIVDQVQGANLVTASGTSIIEQISPEFLQGIASLEAVRRAHSTEYPYPSRFIGVVATMSCGKNGGVNGRLLSDLLGYSFIHTEAGGPYSSIKVVADLSAEIPDIEEAYGSLEEGQTVHLLWAGGVIREVNGETQLVDTGYIEGSILEPLRTPIPYLVTIADIGGEEAARSELAKSLEGVIVRLENVVVDYVGIPDEQGIRSVVLSDETGIQIEALFLPFVTFEIEPGQRFQSVRALVHRPQLEALQLIVEWDGDLDVESS